jgi:hypothetical protein
LNKQKEYPGGVFMMEKLLQYGVITPEQLNQAKYLMRIEGGKIGEKLVELGYVNEKNMRCFATKVLDEI